MEGETLAERLKRGALPIDTALSVAGEIAAALDAAHRHGIVHRDLKPGNVFLTKTAAKLLDFGLAKLERRSNKRDSRGTAGQPVARTSALGCLGVDSRGFAMLMGLVNPLAAVADEDLWRRRPAGR